MLKILTEASGSLTSGYLIKAINEVGYHAIASDVDENIASKYLASSFIKMPNVKDGDLWTKTEELLFHHKVNVVIPSLDETLLEWALRKEYFFKKVSHVIISRPDTIRIFQDKWLTYQFCMENDIPTPKTSLEQIYPLIKPRLGRGSQGIQLTEKPIEMTGMISQEYISGKEYTVDVLCDQSSNPVYIVPRLRLNVKEGKSVYGITVYHEKIIQYVKKICGIISFQGPINIQFMENDNDDIKLIEINPRIAGGMALGFAATENWISLIVNHFIYQKKIEPKQIKYGLKMMRYYEEIFTF